MITKIKGKKLNIFSQEINILRENGKKICKKKMKINLK